MNKSKIKNIFLSFMLVLGMITPVSFAIQSNAFALVDDTPAGDGIDPTAEVSAAQTDVCNGIKATGGSCDDAPGSKTVKDIIALAINILSLIVGVAAVIMIIINGLKFITSNGESAAVASAKNGIIFAIIGLVIVALAQVIVRFVVNRATGL